MQPHNSFNKSKRFLESVSVVINREVVEQKKLMLEGKEFVCFISPCLHQGTVKDMKLNAEQCFAA